MNQAEAKKKWLPLVQALADGELEYLDPRGGAMPTIVINVEIPPESYRRKPKKQSFWVNVYADCESVQCYPTRESADMTVSYGNRIACIEVTFTEGEGL